jgi:hypothetical protein
MAPPFFIPTPCGWCRHTESVDVCYASNMLKGQNLCDMKKQSSTDVFDS